MKKRFLITLLILPFTTFIHAQHLAVPNSILKEIQTIKVPADSTLADSLFFKVVYPENYDKTKTYPVLLGLSGGNQSEEIVNYCYAAYFKSSYFKDYLSIMPVNTNGKNLMQYSQEEIQNLLTKIKENFPVTSENWTIIGTSNGGRASFHYLANEPTLFQGALVLPGVLYENTEVTEAWKHLRIILAYGDQDAENWISGAEKTKKVLLDQVKNVQTIVLEGQEHILPIDFDLDFVYKRYFDMIAE